MKKEFLQTLPLPEFPLWDTQKRIPFSFELEVTARCNNNCRHCCINLPAADSDAKKQELSFEEIRDIVDQALSMGALWCLITGGEPLLREDFREIYLYMKKKGLLLSVFTNATLVTADHVRLFQKYPPRDLEVTVYGVTRETYERVTRKEGSYSAFVKGLSPLLAGGVEVRLKTMALRSNYHEIPEIARFCREKTKDYYRIDPFLHLRYDGNPERNEEIRAERLSAEEIAALEHADPDRLEAMRKICSLQAVAEPSKLDGKHLFRCGAGTDRFNVSFQGLFRLCASLWHQDCVYDLKAGTLQEAWHRLVPSVREIRSINKGFLENCCDCSIVDLCLWCPANAYLETGAMDSYVDYFCRVANARAEMLRVTSVRRESTGKSSTQRMDRTCISTPGGT